MSDLISRSAVLKILNEDGWRYQTIHRRTAGAISKCMDRIERLTAVDAEPVVHAMWIAERERMGHYSHCSKCECRCQGYAPNYKYCPNCGAKMDAKEE